MKDSIPIRWNAIHSKLWVYFCVCVCVVCFDSGNTKYTLKDIYHPNQF